MKIIYGKIYKKSLPKPPESELQEFEWKLWIPNEITHAIIQNAHDLPIAAHGGIAKTLNRIREKYYWPKMANQIRQYVLKRQTCKETFQF